MDKIAMMYRLERDDEAEFWAIAWRGPSDVFHWNDMDFPIDTEVVVPADLMRKIVPEYNFKPIEPEPGVFVKQRPTVTPHPHSVFIWDARPASKAEYEAQVAADEMRRQEEEAKRAEQERLEALAADESDEDEAEPMGDSSDGGETESEEE